MNALNRRLFLKTSAMGAVGAVVSTSVKGGTVDSASIPPGKIITRKLGNTGIEIPVVSLGAGSVDSPAIVKACMKVGINHFDTAHRYQGGNNEKMLGEVLKEYPRDSFTIATKIKPCNTREEFINQFDESLARLQMAYVDILFLHAVDTRDQVFNPVSLDALKIIKAQGRAKHLGMSTHKNEPEIIQAAIDSDMYEVVLASINFKQGHYPQIEEKLAMAGEKGIGIVAMKVMAGGFLDKKKTKPINYKAAIKWVLQNPNVHSTIPAMKNFEQLQSNAQVLSDIKLTDQEKLDLEDASAEAGLYCTGCAECSETCLKRLPIPELMRAYMYTYGYGQSAKAKELISQTNQKSNPCIDCEVCTVQCIKNFDVAQRVTDVSRLLDIPTEFLT